MPKKLFIKTFGCQQNVADSERIAGYYKERGYTLTDNYHKADVVVVNTCMVREQAEEKIYGFAKKLRKVKERENPKLKVIISGCLVGTAKRDKKNYFKTRIEERLGFVDEFLENEEIGYEQDPLRYQTNPTNSEDNDSTTHAWVNISNGCSNYCTFCIVPFARGHEVSRSMEDIFNEIEELIKSGFDRITLLGQNVNSYGSDLVRKQEGRSRKLEVGSKKERDSGFKIQESGENAVGFSEFCLESGQVIKPTMVYSMGKKRIPTLFPQLLLEICERFSGLKKISFVSSNPWDFSDELIDVIAKYPQIDRSLHLPLQSGDTEVLKKMKRYYSKEDYLALVNKIKKAIPGVVFTTDIIVGFPGETEDAFKNSVDVAKRVGFKRAYIARYSPRKGTFAAENYEDDVSQKVKRERFHILDKLINT